MVHHESQHSQCGGTGLPCLLSAGCDSGELPRSSLGSLEQVAQIEFPTAALRWLRPLPLILMPAGLEAEIETAALTRSS
ncbi:MAG: hypothetical protein ACI8T1_004723 [Verrucomicrobiales bacterium]|jgi:hypothetical protein